MSHLDTFVDLALIVVLLSALLILGASRVKTAISLVMLQGLALGVVALVIHGPHVRLPQLLLALVSLVLRGVVFPQLLRRAMKRTNLPKEADSAVPHSLALLLGVGAVGFAVWLGADLDIGAETASHLVVPSALGVIFIGLLLVTIRRRIVSQIVAYLTLENGIYLVGMGLAVETSLVVELGILLDVFVAIFVMGLTFVRIGHELEASDVDTLRSLKD
jgi:hydrogenase-4 component E